MSAAKELVKMAKWQRLQIGDVHISTSSWLEWTNAALVEYEEALALIANLRKSIEDFDKPMSHCGHFQRYLVSGDDGTIYCMECAFESQIKENKRLRDEKGIFNSKDGD